MGGFLIFLLVLIGAIVATPYVLEARRKGLSKRMRNEAPGRFAKLSDGKTYYQWHGPVDGQVLVCVHGLTTPSFIFEGLVRSLTMMGFRVLTYDLYGRGLSDNPRGAQTRAFFLRQLRELLQEQEITEEFSLLGYSMGGTIATILAAEEADRVERLILIAPAGMGYAPSKIEAFMRDTPFIGDWLHRAIGGALLRQWLAALQGVPTAVEDIVVRQTEQTHRRGFSPAVLSSQRHMLRENTDEEMTELNRIYVPIVAIWGEEDAIIPKAAIGHLAEVNRDARQVTIPDTSHWMPITHPREVMAAIQEFMRET
ncbi:MAG: pimeloyl-ACP methyl ester carboxylesterase [Halocynthiibacter sp.]